MSTAPMQTDLFSVGIELDPRIITPQHPDWAKTLKRAKRSKVLTADTETMPLDYKKGMSDDALHPFKNAPRLLQVGVPSTHSNPTIALHPDNMQCLIIDLYELDHTQPTTWPQAHQDLWELLRYATESLDVCLVLQNGKFDLLCWRAWWGWKSQTIMDTFILSNIIWSGLPVSNGLGAIAERCFLQIDKSSQKSDWTAPQLDNRQINYAGNDTLVLGYIARFLLNIAYSSDLKRVNAIEQLFLPALVEMEYNGLPVDIELLKQYQADYDRAYADLIKPLQELHKQLEHQRLQSQSMVKLTDVTVKEFSIASDAHCKAIAKHLTGKTPKKMDKSYLLAQAEHYPLLKNISLLRAIKIYGDVITKMIDCSRWHPEANCWVVSGAIKQFSKGDDDDDSDFGAGTGRTGSGNKGKGMKAPNLQNVPTYDKMPPALRELGLRSPREAVRSPKGCFFVSDLDAAHARIAAKVSGDRVMYDIYTQNRDPHALTVVALSQYLDTPPDPYPQEQDVVIAKSLPDDQRTPWHWLLVKLRNDGKNIFYGSLNDQGTATFQRTLLNAGLSISYENAGKGKAAYWDLYSDLRQFMDNNMAELRNPDCWLKVGRFHYAPVIDPIYGRRVYRLVSPADERKGFAAGPKPSDVSSAIWLAIEASIMKIAAAQVYVYQLAHPDCGQYLGCITHDELDGWSLDPNPDSAHNERFAQVIINGMEGTAASALYPIPPSKKTPKTKDVICESWNDK